MNVLPYRKKKVKEACCIKCSGREKSTIKEAVPFNSFLSSTHFLTTFDCTLYFWATVSVSLWHHACIYPFPYPNGLHSCGDLLLRPWTSDTIISFFLVSCLRCEGFSLTTWPLLSPLHLEVNAFPSRGKLERQYGASARRTVWDCLELMALCNSDSLTYTWWWEQDRPESPFINAAVILHANSFFAQGKNNSTWMWVNQAQCPLGRGQQRAANTAYQHRVQWQSCHTLINGIQVILFYSIWELKALSSMILFHIPFLYLSTSI